MRLYGGGERGRVQFLPAFSLSLMVGDAVVWVEIEGKDQIAMGCRVGRIEFDNAAIAGFRFFVRALATNGDTEIIMRLRQIGRDFDGTAGEFFRFPPVVPVNSVRPKD